MKKHCCKPKVKPVSYNEYFNVGNRVLVDVIKCHHDHVHHQPECVVKPEYPTKPPVKPEHDCGCKEHHHDCFEHPFPPCKPSDNIWTDSNCCEPPHHHIHPCPPIPPHHSHHHNKLEDKDGDGFFEGNFI